MAVNSKENPENEIQELVAMLEKNQNDITMELALNDKYIPLRLTALAIQKNFSTDPKTLTDALARHQLTPQLFANLIKLNDFIEKDPILKPSTLMAFTRHTGHAATTRKESGSTTSPSPKKPSH